MNINLKLGDKVYNISKISDFITSLIPGSENGELTIEPDGNVLKIKIIDSIEKTPLTKVVVPPNIKDKSILGYYDEYKNFCLLPINKEEFIIKNGCGKPKPIRPLFFNKEHL